MMLVDVSSKTKRGGGFIIHIRDENTNGQKHVVPGIGQDVCIVQIVSFVILLKRVHHALLHDVF